MKTWQFIILLVAIFLQPVICYFWFWYWNQHIAFSQVSREQVIDLDKKLNIIIDNQDTIIHNQF